MKLNQSQNPRGHKEGRASFPIKSQYKNLNNPYLYFLERRGRKRERGEGRQQEGRRAAHWAKEEPERERGGEGVFNPNNSQPLKTKLPLDSIRH